MLSTRFFNQRGEHVALGREIARGGEGVIYELARDSQNVAKLYLASPSTEKAEKLIWMAANVPSGFEKFAAWPSGTLHAGRPGGPIQGFTMPKVSGYKAVHLLYATASRRKEFPTAYWDFLARTALNCANAFEELHRAGHMVGDVNESNLLVSPKDTTVRLIDCDSFQLYAGNRLFRCEVGVPFFTPPELQGKDFRSVTRTLTHDQFGLAVLLFQLLFLGRHPFTGIFSGSGDMTPERAISEFRFAYGKNAGRFQMAPPAIYLPLLTLPLDLVELFERAFSPTAPNSGRPDASSWRQSLSSLVRTLKVCPQEQSHRYPGHLQHCPWCQLAANHRVAFFISGSTTRGTLQFACSMKDLDPVWRELQRLLNSSIPAPVIPPSSLALPLQLPPAVQAEISRGQRRSLAMAIGGISVTLGWWILLFASSPVGVFVIISGFMLLSGAAVYWLRYRRRMTFPALLNELRNALRVAQERLTASRVEYEGTRGEFGSLGKAAQHRLEELRAEYSRLQPDYEAEQRRLLDNREALQRSDYLRNVLIEDHNFDGIKAGLKSNLVRWGIESAYDVLHDDIRRVPGFGEIRTRKLVAWAEEIRRRFRFDPGRAVSEAERRAIIFKFQQRQASVKSRIEAELADLQSRWQEASHRVSELAAKVDAAQKTLTNAETALPASMEVLEASLRSPAWEGRHFWLTLLAISVVSWVVALGSRTGARDISPPLAQTESSAAVVVEPTPSPALPPFQGVSRVLTRGCVVRELPTVSAPSITVLTAGSRLLVGETQGGWRKVLLDDGRLGWTGPRCWTRPTGASISVDAEDE